MVIIIILNALASKHNAIIMIVIVTSGDNIVLFVNAKIA
jgi:hypothetical protein